MLMHNFYSAHIPSPSVVAVCTAYANKKQSITPEKARRLIKYHGLSGAIYWAGQTIKTTPAPVDTYAQKIGDSLPSYSITKTDISPVKQTITQRNIEFYDKNGKITHIIENDVNGGYNPIIKTEKDFPVIPTASQLYLNQYGIARSLLYILPAAPVWNDFTICINAAKVLLTICKTKFQKVSAAASAAPRLYWRLSTAGQVYMRLCAFYADNVNNADITTADINTAIRRITSAYCEHDTELFEMFSLANLTIHKYSVCWQYGLPTALRAAQSAINTYLQKEVKATINTYFDISTADCAICLSDIAAFVDFVNRDTVQRYLADHDIDENGGKTQVLIIAAKINMLLSDIGGKYDYYLVEKGKHVKHTAAITEDIVNIFNRYVDIKNGIKGGSDADGLGCLATEYGMKRATIQGIIRRVRNVILFNVFGIKDINDYTADLLK